MCIDPSGEALEHPPPGNFPHPPCIQGSRTLRDAVPEPAGKRGYAHASHSVRLSVFGVGNDVNTALLDKLAEDNRGWRVYATPGE